MESSSRNGIDKEYIFFFSSLILIVVTVLKMIIFSNLMDSER